MDGMPLLCHMEVGNRTLQTEVVIPIFKKRDQKMCLKYLIHSTSPGKFIQDGWKGGFDLLLNIRFTKINADSIQAMELWTNSVPLQT